MKCMICNENFEPKEMFPIELIRESIHSFIKKTNPNLPETGFICTADLNRYHQQHLSNLVESEHTELSDLDNDVLRNIENKELMAENINDQYEEKLTFGDKVSDNVSRFGGSWKFIISFFVVLVGWMAINSIAFFMKTPFDPYPYILLNLVLSCLAAIQAPIIMMSQNRQAKKDRLISDHDYKINLKSELQIRILNSKIDHLMKHQWKKMMELDKLHTKTYNEIKHKDSA